MPKYNIHSDDPMEMIWAVREKIYEETKNMTDDEWNDYLNVASKRVRADIEQLLAADQVAIAAGQYVKKAWE
ncbi:MAG: hypothetical protein ACRCUY_03735 [Thermoguttaceae bacterium]